MTSFKETLVERNASVSGTVGGKAVGLTFDANDYLPLLGDTDLSEAQTHELLVTLWSIMCGFVELGLRVDVCGELGLDALRVLSSEAASLGSGLCIRARR